MGKFNQSQNTMFTLKITEVFQESPHRNQHLTRSNQNYQQVHITLKKADK